MPGWGAGRDDSGMPVIEVSGLHKEYGPKVAVDDVSFSVEPGEIFGILGPNGAGKTTTVECIGGLRHRDGGTVTRAGLAPGGQSAGHPTAGTPAARQDDGQRGPRALFELLSQSAQFR